MDWQYLALFLATWTIASVPFGMLVGRMIAVGERMDEAQRRSHQMVLLPPPSLALAFEAPGRTSLTIDVPDFISPRTV